METQEFVPGSALEAAIAEATRAVDAERAAAEQARAGEQRARQATWDAEALVFLRATLGDAVAEALAPIAHGDGERNRARIRYRETNVVFSEDAIGSTPTFWMQRVDDKWGQEIGGAVRCLVLPRDFLYWLGQIADAATTERREKGGS